MPHNYLKIPRFLSSEPWFSHSLHPTHSSTHFLVPSVSKSWVPDLTQLSQLIGQGGGVRWLAQFATSKADRHPVLPLTDFEIRAKWQTSTLTGFISAIPPSRAWQFPSELLHTSTGIANSLTLTTWAMSSVCPKPRNSEVCIRAILCLCLKVGWLAKPPQKAGSTRL